MRPVLAEMGGKNPAFVTESADLRVAASGVARSAFGLSGQKCSALSKVYVAREIMDDFLGALVETTNKLTVGDPRHQGVFMGPVINEAARDRFTRRADDAAAAGSIVLGGAPACPAVCSIAGLMSRRQGSGDSGRSPDQP